MKTKILDILNRIKNKHLNDPSKMLDFEEILNLLLSDANKTIKLINELDEDSLEWISSNFEELSYKFQNEQFVNCVKYLLIKFPNSSILKQDVNDAIEAYYGNEEE